MESFIIYPRNKKQLKALKTISKALRIDFKSTMHFYNPNFVDKIIQGREDIKNGKGIRIATEDLWK